MSTSINGRMNSNQAIPRQSLTAAVADRLRDMILRGEFHEGEQLRQHVIAAEFDVSRIPLREAFRQLEAEGLIKIIDHRGAVVSALSPDEIEELFDILAALESVTLRQAVPRLTDEDLERAEKSLEAYEQALNNESEFDVWGELHWQFHSTLYSAANRTRSLSLIQTINNNADRYIRLHILFTRDAHRHSKDEHRAILELCRRRDAEAACQMLERHISQDGHVMRAFIKQQREQD